MRRIWRKAQKDTGKKNFKSNHQITAPIVSLIIDREGPIGDLPLEKALAMAEEAGLDLVEVNPKANPPVVKMLDFGQFKYEQEKAKHKQKQQQKKVEVKSLRLSPRIGQHDFDLRINQALKFLNKGNKLKVELNLKGRERQHSQKAVELMNNFWRKLEETENLKIFKEQDLTRQGASFTMIVANKTN